MTFLSQTLLWGILAASVPVIIHLLNRRRFRTVQWAATSFLLKASRESKGKKKLRHLLILLCRALAIAALFIAVARPLVSGLLGLNSGSINTIVLILDRSASMELRAGDGQPTLRESILKKVSESIEVLGAPRLILVDSATREIQDIPSPEILAQLSTTFATDTQSDIPELLLKTIEYLTETQPGTTEIWLASDLQRGDWNPSDARWEAIRSGLNALPTQTQLRLITTGENTSNNLALELLSTRREENRLLLDLRLTRSNAKEDKNISITSSLQGARSSEQVTLSGQELRFRKKLNLPGNDEEGFGWIGLNPDDNLRDNAVFFAYGKKKNMNSWVISEKTDSESVQFLKRAAAPSGFDRNQCQIIHPRQISEINWNEASLIIWQAPLPDGNQSTLLKSFIESGGSAIFLPPEGDSQHSLYGISWGEIESAPQSEFFISGSWVKDDGPWQDGADGNTLPINKLKALKRRSIQGDVITLAKWDDNQPLLTRQIQGRGRCIFLATLPDDRWSNLEFTALHLVAIQRLLIEGADRLDDNYRAIAGSEKAQAQTDESRTRLDSFEDFEPALGANRAGVYRVGERVIAVNRPAEESDPTKISQETLDELLEGTSYRLFTDEQTDEDLASEVWQSFLIAALFFLIGEALLCLQAKPAQPIHRAMAPSPPAS